MPHAEFSTARVHLGLLAACLLVATALPGWHKLWFVAASGHYGGGFTWPLLLLLGLYRRWHPAFTLTSIYLLLQLLVAAYVLSYNVTTGGPLLGFVLTGSLSLVALLLLHRSVAIRHYLSHRPAGIV